MPSPCSTPLATDPAQLDSSLVARSETPLAASCHSDASFDAVLSDCEPAPNVELSTASVDLPAGAPLTAEQLAYLSSLMMPAPAAAPVPVAPEARSASELVGEFNLVTGEGKSAAELLGRGVETLEFKLQPPHSGVPAEKVETAKPATEGVLIEEPPITQRTAEFGAPATVAADPRTFDPRSPLNAEKLAMALGSRPANPMGDTSGAVGAVTAPETHATAETAQAATLQANSRGDAAPAGSNGPAPARPIIRGMFREKFAATSSTLGTPGGMSPAPEAKNPELANDVKALTEESLKVGTAAANWGEPMAAAQNFRSPTASPITEIGAGFGARMEVVATGHADRSVQVALEPVSHAAAMVSEIRDIADSLRAVERNSVEVKFDFGAEDKLSVRVEYKDGLVQATFRTDNRDLRDAIAREWNFQTNTNEARSYRIADPVFSSPQHSPGHDASRQQQQRTNEEFQSFFRGAPVSTRSSAAAPQSVASPAVRPENTGRFHAIV
jgi:hypothetical protein